MHWPVYALALAALAAEVLYQMALHVGPLSYSQPFLVIVDPIVSIALSVWVFGETFTADTLRVALAAVAFAAMCVSVAVLTQTAPADDDGGLRTRRFIVTGHRQRRRSGLLRRSPHQ